MKRFGRRSRWIAPAAGSAALLLVIVIALGNPWGLADGAREAAFDRAISWTPRKPASSPTIVIDIDRAALDRFGSWPWPRETLAKIVAAAAPLQPSAMAFDMLLAEQRSAGDAAPSDLDALADALKRAPVVLGVVLDPARNAPTPEGPPMLVQGAPPELPGLMIALGVTAPVERLRDAAKGLGVLTLAAPDGDPIRRAPLLAAGGGVVYGGLGVEALRVASGDGNLVVDGGARTLRIGSYAIALGPDADLRLWPAAAEYRARRTVPVAQLLDDAEMLRSAIAGKVLIIGASAPETGGLRPTSADPFTPTAQIHADVIEQIVDGRAPRRPFSVMWLEIAASVALAAVAIVAVSCWPPGRASAATLALAALWLVACVAMWRWRALLVDPVWPSLAGLAAWQAAGWASFAEARARRVALERSFATRLPPEIVARLANDPDQLKLAGEEREITALFTDIEGFTAMTERLGPADLVGLLDRYFDCVCGIVVAHGGMVDKFVGDAVHAFFNAPIDLPDHAGRAVDCALAIHAATGRFRAEPENARFALGRTRIGVETGRAILGDVGAGRKLDYTAHGMAINLAARLEASNKTFGSSIAVGPRCVELCVRHGFRELGTIEPFAGAQPLRVFEPLAIEERRV